MKSLSRTERAIQCVDREPDLARFLGAAPQAILMPMGSDHDERYLVLVLFLVESALDYETLSFICSRAIDLVDKEGVLADIGGVEILASVLRQGATRRVLRLSVLTKAIDWAKHLTSEQIRKPIPTDGVTSHFYLADIGKP